MEMSQDDLVRRLKESGTRIVCSQRNGAGEVVHLVRLASGETAPMFHSDAEQLAAGGATLQGIIARNARADLGGPWPALTQVPESGTCPECDQEGTLRRWIRSGQDHVTPEDASLDVIVCMVCDYATQDEGVHPAFSALRVRPVVRRSC